MLVGQGGRGGCSSMLYNVGFFLCRVVKVVLVVTC